MNMRKIIFGIILLALIPTHWFLGGVVLSSLAGFPGMVVVALWLLLLLSGISLIIDGLNEPDHIQFQHPHKTQFGKDHISKDYTDQYRK